MESERVAVRFDAHHHHQISQLLLPTFGLEILQDFADFLFLLFGSFVVTADDVQVIQLRKGQGFGFACLLLFWHFLQKLHEMFSCLQCLLLLLEKNVQHAPQPAGELILLQYLLRHFFPLHQGFPQLLLRLHRPPLPVVDHAELRVDAGQSGWQKLQVLPLHRRQHVLRLLQRLLRLLQFAQLHVEIADEFVELREGEVVGAFHEEDGGDSLFEVFDGCGEVLGAGVVESLLLEDVGEEVEIAVGVGGAEFEEFVEGGVGLLEGHPAVEHQAEQLLAVLLGEERTQRLEGGFFPQLSLQLRKHVGLYGTEAAHPAQHRPQHHQSYNQYPAVQPNPPRPKAHPCADCLPRVAGRLF